MGFLDDLNAENAERKRNQIEVAIDQLSGNDLKDFVTALHNIRIPAVSIERALRKRGITVDARRISDYRNNGGRVRYGLDGKRVISG
jgi:hypothetical protein